jgi:hypothetical protein
MTKPIDWGAVHRIRFAHVKSVLRDRYHKYEVPDDDAGNDDLCIFLHVKASAHKPGGREKALYNEITLWAPWMSAEEARKLAAEIAGNPIKFTSATLGQRLNLDSATRERLRVWQIRAADSNAEVEKERKRERRRQQDRERKRRARQPRAAYLAAVTKNSERQTKPWIAMGINRATYYRRRAKGATRSVRKTCKKMRPGPSAQVTLITKRTHPVARQTSQTGKA